MPFLRAKGLQRRQGRRLPTGRDRLNALPAGEGSATTAATALEQGVETVSMPFLRAKGLQQDIRRITGIKLPMSQCPSCGRRVCNWCLRSARRRWFGLSQCPSCGRRVCNIAAAVREFIRVRLNALPAGEGSATPEHRPGVVAGRDQVSMPFLRAKGLQPRSSVIGGERGRLNALPAGEGSATRLSWV